MERLANCRVFPTIVNKRNIICSMICYVMIHGRAPITKRVSCFSSIFFTRLFRVYKNHQLYWRQTTDSQRGWTSRVSKPDERERIHAFVQPGSSIHTMDIWAFCRGVKQPGLCFDHTFSSGAEIKEIVELYLFSALCLHGML